MTATEKFYTKQDAQILMIVYNKARAAAKAEKSYKGKRLEVGRVDRAFGILQSRDYVGIRRYVTDRNNCGCDDCLYRTWVICKHRTSDMMEDRILEIEDKADFLARNWEWAKVEVVKEQRTKAQILKSLGY